MARKECSIGVVGRKGVVEVGESVCIFVLSAGCGVRVLTPDELEKRGQHGEREKLFSCFSIIKEMHVFSPSLGQMITSEPLHSL